MFPLSTTSEPSSMKGSFSSDSVATDGLFWSVMEFEDGELHKATWIGAKKVHSQHKINRNSVLRKTWETESVFAWAVPGKILDYICMENCDWIGF